MHVPHHAAADEDALDRRQVRVLDLLDHLHVLELDVEELVYALKGAADGDVVLELDGYFGVDEGFEEAGWVSCGSVGEKDWELEE